MKKKYYKGVAGAVTSALLCSTILTTFPSNTNAEELDSNFEFEEYYNEYEDSLDGIVIELNEEETNELLNMIDQYHVDKDYSVINDNHMMIQPLGAGTASIKGTYLATVSIIGIGSVAIYTGCIVIADAVFDFTSSVYNKVKSFVDPYIIGAKIPKSIRKDGDTVDLGQFKDKDNNTPLNKSSGSFKSTKKSEWTVEKDTAGHGGRKWKLKKRGDRIASLDADGKIIAD